MKRLSMIIPLLLVFVTACDVTEKTPITTSTIAPTATSTMTSAPTETLAPTPLPSPTPTLVPALDQDNDGLTNYEETVKYHTDPYSQDSDGDGVSDSDWDERREYVYSVHIIMKLRQPFDLSAMNDMYQDVMVVEEEDTWGYTIIDAIIYPETDLPLLSSPYPINSLDSELLIYTTPGISTNYSPQMQEEVMKIMDPVKSDVKAVEKIISWFHKNTKLADFPFQTEVFYFAYVYNGEVYLRNPPNLSLRRMLDELLFADSMFDKRVHGTCCSTATLKCAMIKSAGIPCKIIQTLFPIFSHVDQIEPYENKLNRSWPPGFEDQPSGTSINANHCFLEVYLGGQWVRVDNEVNIYHGERNLSIKILSVADLTEIDFSRTYPVDWIYNRPYYTLLLEDQEPIH